ncbi:MAG: ATP-binding protein [Clostridia bacterium]|nr:ATP-binding protein [Clostridia bacterium]
MNGFNQIQLLHIKLSALSVYHGLLRDALIRSLDALLDGMKDAPDVFAARWGEFFSLLSAEDCRAESLSDAIYNKVVYDDNVFTRAAAGGEIFGGGADKSWSDGCTLSAVHRDLATLRELAALTPQALLEAYPRREAFGDAPFDILPRWDCGSMDITYDGIVRFHMANGCGEYARYIAFVRRAGHCVPIPNPDFVTLDSLKGYETVRQPVIDNTLAFLSGLPANNCLLYGDRGTGKSSTVKALLNEFCDRGLRLIELPKPYLSEYPDIVQEIAGLPLKFIIFIDDLSFQAGDENYAALKGVLEGGIASRPDNALIYATTNRRHMLNEAFSDRRGDEIHASDTIQESLSLSDRFGVQVTFLAPDRTNYFRIIHALAQERRLRVDALELEMAAERWATLKGGRSPRTAVQFIDDAEARLARGLAL